MYQIKTNSHNIIFYENYIIKNINKKNRKNRKKLLIEYNVNKLIEKIIINNNLDIKIPKIYEKNEEKSYLKMEKIIYPKKINNNINEKYEIPNFSYFYSQKDCITMEIYHFKEIDKLFNNNFDEYLINYKIPNDLGIIFAELLLNNNIILSDFELIIGKDNIYIIDFDKVHLFDRETNKSNYNYELKDYMNYYPFNNNYNKQKEYFLDGIKKIDKNNYIINLLK